MATTYSTSEVCRKVAGMRTLDTTTNPTLEMVDEFRSIAKRKIYKIAKTMTDPDEVAMGIEIELVKWQINNIRKKMNTVIELTPDQEDQLRGSFNTYAVESLEMNENGWG